MCTVYVAVLNEPMNFPLVGEWEIARGKEKESLTSEVVGFHEWEIHHLALQRTLYR